MKNEIINVNMSRKCIVYAKKIIVGIQSHVFVRTEGI